MAQTITTSQGAGDMGEVVIEVVQRHEPQRIRQRKVRYNSISTSRCHNNANTTQLLKAIHEEYRFLRA